MTPLCCLLIEDSEDDARMVLRELRIAGYDVTAERVTTLAAMKEALNHQSWDIVISDAALSQFSALAELELIRERRLDLPLIVVAGEAGEDQAVAAIKAGARGYVSRGNLARLGTVVHQALERSGLHEERTAMVERLRQAEAKYRSIFEHAHEGILQTLPDGTPLAANPAVARIFGYPSADALLRDAQNIVALYADPGQRDRLKQELQKSGSVANYEIRLRRRDGTIIWTSNNIQMVQDAQGRVRYEGTVVDITERKQWDEALRLQSAALTAAANAITITDREGTIVWANPAFTALTGYTLAEAAGRNPRELLKSGDHAREFYRDLWETILAGRVWHGEMVNRRKDGSRYPEAMTVTPVRDAQGGITHFIAIKEDLTERKKLEAQFLRAQRMEAIGMLAGGVAHDLNNILAPMLMAAGLLKENITDPRDREMLTMVERSAQRGADIVRQLLTFSRGTSGVRSTVQVRHLLKEVGAILRETFPREIECTENFPPDLWLVVADATQLNQVLVNLCINARDAMPDGGALTLRAANVMLAEGDGRLGPKAKPGAYVEFTVADTGMGMTPEMIERIFDPFFTTKDLGKGTGLGLSTVLGIVHSHEGFVTVASEPRCGSTFRVFIPATPEGETKPPVATNQPFPGGKGELILVVDDEEPIRTSFRQVLEQHHYRVETAANGREAIAKFLDYRDSVKLVLTDLMMPEMGGVALVRALRLLQPGLHVIATSGLQSGDGKTGMAGLDVNEVLPKPCGRTELLEAIGRELAVHPVTDDAGGALNLRK